jgi:hypothetical protein
MKQIGGRADRSRQGVANVAQRWVYMLDHHE